MMKMTMIVHLAAVITAAQEIQAAVLQTQAAAVLQEAQAAVHQAVVLPQVQKAAQTAVLQAQAAAVLQEVQLTQVAMVAAQVLR